MQGLCQRFFQSVTLRSAVLTNLKNDASVLDQVSRRYHSLASFRSALGSYSLSTCMNTRPSTTKPKIPGLTTSSLTLSRSVVTLQNYVNSCNRIPNLRKLNRTGLTEFTRTKTSLQRMHRLGPHIKKRPPRKPLDGNPFMKGIILRTLIKKPKKPNSANRKCVLVKLSNGKEKVAYVPGVGHNLQEHNVVLVRVGRLRDVPGVKIKCVRGVYDLPHVQKAKK